MLICKIKDPSSRIIYNTDDGKTNVALYAKDGMVWMTQNQLAELFDTSKQNISQHIANILNEKELPENSVVKNYFTTAADGKEDPRVRVGKALSAHLVCNIDS